jgi:Tfp pilus assembly protein PilF
MIELMLEAERAMGIGLLDNAERLYRQVVAIDPHNSIAVTGLARVALERGDQRAAYTLARQALTIDPDNPIAGHLAMRMAEQMRNRGEALPDDLEPDQTGPRPAAARAPGTPVGETGAEPGARPSRLVDRFLRRRR